MPQVAADEAAEPPVAADVFAMSTVAADEAAAYLGIPGLVRKLEDPPMRSVQAVGIPRLASPKAAVPIPEILLHSVSPQSPLQSPLHSMNPQSPLQEPTEPAPFWEPTEPAPFWGPTPS